MLADSRQGLQLTRIKENDSLILIGLQILLVNISQVCTTITIGVRMGCRICHISTYCKLTYYLIGVHNKTHWNI